MRDEGSTPLLSLERVSSGYTNVPVLRGIDLHVGEGEVVGVLGANGAGKTTLLRTIAGVIPTSSGSIRLAGRDLARTKPWNRVRQGIAHVPEGRHVFTEMTVEENLRVAGLVAKSRSGGVGEVYELFPRLAERRVQLAGTLSGGEQQMLAIGRALMTRPQVLLADELSAGLAPIITIQLVESLERIRQAGVSMVVVEQSPTYIADLVDRVYLLEHGSIVSTGTLEEVGGTAKLTELYLGVR
jgi:branched-chain amino acid transport system ATP-binding protein